MKMTNLAHVAKGCIVALVGLTLIGCRSNDDDDDGSSSGNTSSPTSGSSWLVGDDGEMLRMGAAGDVQPYPLAEDADLVAIACLGAQAAWVVGSAGTVLSTDDAGVTWERHELGIEGDLNAVAVAESHDHPWVVVIAGTDGVVLERRGDGEFTRVAAPEIDWSAVATDEHGESILLAGDDGSLWRSLDGTAEQVFATDGAQFHGLATTPHGDRAVAVGSGGLVVVSDDSGATWSPIAVPTVRDLYAARISSDGTQIIAVGEAGVVVTIDPAGAGATEQLDPSLTLRGLHMHAAGSGHAVGDAGIVLFTADVGRSWTAIETGTDAILRGVDDVHLGAHW
jgi:photosystem II stability/assembly factor-like uncharacterized protein